MRINFNEAKMIFISLLLLSVCCANVELVLLRVEQGLLRGQTLQRVTDNGTYYSFKGIPFAAPPVGKLRFRAPQPPLPWEGVRCAKAHGSKCPQVNVDTFEFVPGNEDCLFLNVYTNSLEPKTPLPVMVFIVGGALIAGSGDDDRFGPDFLLDHDVILVTFNYRVGALGFLSLDIEEAPGNAGFKDQVAVLRWVKKNIEKFGGDPDNVTLFGQSIGGASVSLHLLSPMSRGLFKHAIAMSGVFLTDTVSSFFEHKRYALYLTKQLGLYTENQKEALEFLQNATVESLVRTQPSVMLTDKPRREVFDFMPFTLVVEKDFGDDHFITEDPLKLLIEGRSNEVDLILGHTPLEGTYRVVTQKDAILKYYPFYNEMLVPLKIAYKRDPKTVLQLSDRIKEHYFGSKQISNDTMKEIIIYYSYFNYIYDIHRYLEMWTKTGRKAYFYEFSAFTERNINGKYGIEYGLEGATHADDLSYIFYANKNPLPLNKDGPSYKVVEQTCTLYTNFAKYGNPTPDNSLGVIWTDYNTNMTYLDINVQLTLKKVDTKPQIDFWRSIFNSVGLIFS